MEDLSYMLEEYYDSIGVIPKNNREVDQVMARSALMVALRPYMTTTQIGRMFDRNHATVVHAVRNHEVNLGWSEMYESFFETAQQIVINNPTKSIRRDSRLTAILTRHKMHITELKAENEELTKKVSELLESICILEKENKNLSQYADRV